MIVNKLYFSTAPFYRITNDSQSAQTPCYAVVDDISQYSSTEFDKVYNKATDSWYMKNNLNQYEQYGIYDTTTGGTYYEGKLAIVDGYEYEYGNGSWNNVGEISGSTASLPNIPFTVNYNAKNFDSSTNTFLKTSGQLANTDVTLAGTVATVGEDYIEYIGDSGQNYGGAISGYQDYFNRTSSDPQLTIIAKAIGSISCHLFSNRYSTYNWMFRWYGDKLTLHGNGGEIGSIEVSNDSANIASVRVNSNCHIYYNNWTSSASTSPISFSYGNTNTASSGLFNGYGGLNNGECFIGTFYWIYISQNELTDEQIQQVIAYNEGNGQQTTYPVYYEELDAPVDNLQFISLRSANAYQCPYYGLNADISTEPYIYTISNNWLPKYDWVVMPNDYYCRQGDKYEKLEYSERQGDNTFIGLGEYEFGELIETGSEDCSSLVPSDYIELEYFTVPYISYARSVFYIKCKNNAAYDYTIDFMPLNWETGSYYKHLLGGNDEGTNFGKVYIYPLDNGWGSIYYRTIASLANYNLSTRSGNPLSGQYGFHDNVKASVTLCYNEHILNNGAKIKVENEGYPEYIGTSTSTTGSSVAYDTEYDIPLFTRASTDTNGATFLPYMRFYKFQVYDTVNETDAYHYVPVKRVSDNKVGLFDIANQIFYAPTAFDFEAGPEK